MQPAFFVQFFIAQILDENFVQFYPLTKEKKYDIIGGARWAAARQIFHYNTWLRFCQANFAKNLTKSVSRNLCKMHNAKF
jgi:hypothetical protein